jgi:hypothetical protein
MGGSMLHNMNVKAIDRFLLAIYSEIAKFVRVAGMTAFGFMLWALAAAFSFGVLWALLWVIHRAWELT